MDNEEREEIPWSTLVAEADQGVDRRWYIVAIGVGLVVAAVLGFRLLSGTSQPTPLVATTSMDPSTSVVAPATEGTLVVAEADLRANEPAVIDLATELVAEAFVTDYFTNDGSPETARSLLEVVAPGLASDLQTEREAMRATTFVEWAKVYAIDRADGVFAVRVAYRSIVATNDGFDRLPVAAVEVMIANDDALPSGRTGAVMSLPSPVDLP